MALASVHKKINPEFVEIVFRIYQLHLISAAIYNRTNEIFSFSRLQVIYANLFDAFHATDSHRINE